MESNNQAAPAVAPKSKDGVKLRIISISPLRDEEGFKVITDKSVDYNPTGAFVFRGSKALTELINLGIPNARIDMDNATNTLGSLVALPAKSYLTFDAKYGVAGETYTDAKGQPKQYTKTGMNTLNTRVELSEVAKMDLKDLQNTITIGLANLAATQRLAKGYSRPATIDRKPVETAETFQHEEQDIAQEQIAE